MVNNNIKELIDTSKQGIDYYLSLVLLKGYKVMLKIDSDGIIKLRYVDSNSNTGLISGSSCSDVVAKLYAKVLDKRGNDD